MHVSWNTWETANGQIEQVKKCDFIIGPHCLTVEQGGDDELFIIRYYRHRLEVGPQPGDNEITIRGIASGRKDQVIVSERPLKAE